MKAALHDLQIAALDCADPPKLAVMRRGRNGFFSFGVQLQAAAVEAGSDA